MSHHIYHTRGVILSSTPSGESNRFYKIFTLELGLIGATAQAVREGKSKLRYTLQDFSFVTVDLVRGKEVWRIVSAGANRPLETTKSDTARIEFFARFCTFILRMIHGEGRDTGLFEEIERVTDFLEQRAINKDRILSFETLTTFRVLAHLGYVNPVGYEKFLSPSAYSTSILEEFEKVRPTVLHKINDAMSASHL